MCSTYRSRRACIHEGADGWGTGARLLGAGRTTTAPGGWSQRASASMTSFRPQQDGGESDRDQEARDAVIRDANTPHSANAANSTPKRRRLIAAGRFRAGSADARVRSSPGRFRNGRRRLVRRPGSASTH
jgi:hypothetical protein